MVAADFTAYLRGQPLLVRPLFPFQWRLTNAALDLPFLFLQLLVTSIARERPSRRNLALSGLVFVLTFYVYFYLWTMIAAGLCLAMLIDPTGRRTYAWTLGAGILLGWPQLAHDYLIKSALSAEGVRHFWLLTASGHSASLSNDSPYYRPYLVIAEAIIIGVWAIRRGHPALLLAWCLGCAGVCLSLSNIATGIFIHNYHWAWLSVPLMHIVMVAMALDLVMLWKPRLPIPGWVAALFVSAYLLSGIYLTGSINLIGPRNYDDRKVVYYEYNRQRLVRGVAPFKPESVIAGDPNFVDIAAIAERQRPLAGRFLAVDMAMDDEQRRIRFVLDQYLSGIDHDNFAVLLNSYSSFITREQHPVYLRMFDEISRDSEKYLDDLKVRYLAISASQRAPAFLSHGWELMQPGPYWQIWERRL
jgi:hypothetical protein